MTEAMRGHSLIKFFTQAEWAILPDKLEQLEEVLNQFIAGDNVLVNDDVSQDPFVSRGGVAVIPVTGTITKRAYGLSAMSGVRTTLDIQNDIQSALDNSAVSGIVLSIDSPGGTVDGTKELADFIAKAKDVKPIVSYVDGLMASAAYWIGCQATSIVCYDTAKVGSVGVVVKHQEASKVEEKLGVVTTFIYQGKYKVAGNQHEALSAEDKAYIQGHVDTYYSMFVDSVAEGRGIDRDTVIKDIALGSVFIGKDALAINLVDSIGNMNDAISLARKLGEEKMNLEEAQVQLTEQGEQIIVLGGQVAEVTTQLTEATSTIATLTEQLAAKDADIATRIATDEAAQRLVDVTAMFEGCGVDDSFIAGMVALTDEAIAPIASQLKEKQTKITATLGEFTETTEGAHSEQGDLTTPVSIDAAIAMIEERDSCDVDEATDKAQEEFPQLFK
jgi:signal peptide peptidase SppA